MVIVGNESGSCRLLIIDFAWAFPFLFKKGSGFPLQSFLKRKGFTLQSLTRHYECYSGVDQKRVPYQGHSNYVNHGVFIFIEIGP